MTTLRDTHRYKRRLPVRFWRANDTRPHEAFTVNVSLGGMFIATRAVAPPRSRVRVQVADGKHDFLFHGLVMHAIKVPPGFQRVRDSGMGVRLLQVRELMAELLEGRPERAAGPRPAPPGAEPRPAGGAPAAASGRPGRYLATPGAASGRGAEETAAEPEPEPAVYVVRFSSPEVFLDVFRRHHEEGGFFVPTQEPSPRGQQVVVTLEMLQSDVAPLALDARVLEVVTAELGQAAGMRVTFSDPDSALDALGRVIRSLRKA